MTFRSSYDENEVSEGKKAVIVISSGVPAVGYAKFEKKSASKGESVKVIVKTNADAKQLKMYSESGALAKSWNAEGNSEVRGTERIWEISYAFGGTGDRKVTFRATKDGSTMHLQG